MMSVENGISIKCLGGLKRVRRATGQQGKRVKRFYVITVNSRWKDGGGGGGGGGGGRRGKEGSGGCRKPRLVIVDAGQLEITKKCVAAVRPGRYLPNN